MVSIVRAAALVALIALGACQGRIQQSAVKDFADALGVAAKRIDEGLTRVSQLETERQIDGAAPGYLAPLPRRKSGADPAPVTLPPRGGYGSAAVRHGLGDSLEFLAMYAQHLAFLSGDEATAPTEAAIKGLAQAAEAGIKQMGGLQGVSEEQAKGVGAIAVTIANVIVQYKVQAGLAEAVTRNQPNIQQFGQFIHEVVVGDGQIGLAASIKSDIEYVAEARTRALGYIRSDPSVPADRRLAAWREIVARNRQDQAVAAIPGAIANAVDKMVEAHGKLAEPAKAGSSVGGFIAAVNEVTRLYEQARRS